MSSTVLLGFQKSVNFAHDKLIAYNFIAMRKYLSISKGLDLRLAGAAPGVPGKAPVVVPESVAVVPDDYPGLTLKMSVREGDKVKAGSPLLHDKSNENIVVVSPVAGTVRAIVRGERRKIERVVVAPDATDDAVVYSPGKDLKELMMESGLWAMMRQRPFDIVPSPDVRPRDIFITAMDTAPLAISPLTGLDTEAIARGAKALATLTGGKLYLSIAASVEFPDIDGVEIVEVKGPHPAGNVGVQIANIAPVNKGETVWALEVAMVARLGTLLMTGKPDFSTLVAVTGPEAVSPCICRTDIGADIASLVKGHIADDGVNHRIISGNVLTGINVGADGYLRRPWRQVTIMAEGDDRDELMGWASLNPKKLSVSSSFPSRFSRRRLFSPDARINGGRRAMIMSGLYDKVMPMDIMTEYLIKAILARDIERMEALGIYEVAPEDFALAEFVDPSKLELQKIVGEGLDYLRKEI